MKLAKVAREERAMELAKTAYEAYNATLGGSIRSFEEIPESARAAWKAAAEAVREEAIW